MKKSTLNNKWLSIQIAYKELVHNSFSSSLIMLVIAAICLPLLILTSLKEGYLAILKENFYKSNQATRIDILATNTKLEQQKITDARVLEYSEVTGVKAVVPSRSHKVFTYDDQGNGDEKKFDAVTTVPNDPDLARFGFEGQFGEKEIEQVKSVILSKQTLRDLGYDSIVPKTIPLVVKRSSKANRRQEYLIDCQVIGTVSGGLRGKIYVPMSLDREIERFQLGLSAPKLGLPADPASEETLSIPTYPYCVLMSRQPLYELEKDGAEIGGKKYKIESLDGDKLLISSIFFYKITLTDASEVLEYRDWQLIKSYLSAEDIQVMPHIEPLNLTFQGKTLKLSPAAILKNDMRHKFLLEKGRWLNPERDRFEIVIPKNIVEGTLTLPHKFTQKIGGNSVNFVIQGLSNIEEGFIDFGVLYRLKELEKGVVKIGENSKYFETTEANPYVNRYLMAGIHANSIEEVLPLIDYFRNDKDYEIFGSSEAKVKAIQQYSRLLNNFTLLISIAGILAGITALWVLMYEAIKRKKNQIGIMRAMGLPKEFITKIYLWQSLAYGLGGFIIAFILFKIFVTSILESALGRAILDIQNVDGQVFITPAHLILSFLIGILIVSYVAGRSAAQSVRNIDPADILTD